MVSHQDMVTVLMRQNLELTWFRIAVEHERAALQVRRQAEEALVASENPGSAFDDEMRAAMVAIAAAAFAVDAMFAKVDEFLDPAERIPADRGCRRIGRIGRIVETFKIALDLGGRTQGWQRDVRRLFELRGEMVHFGGEATPGLLHPTGSTNVSREAGTYTVEEATRSVDLALDVLTVARTSPRSRHERLVEWAAQESDVPAYLQAVRRGDA